jgi:hypothetical protein
MTQAQQVLDYLRAVAPEGATNAQLAEKLGIASQQTVYMLTRELVARGWVRDERQGRTLVFFAHEGPLLGSEPGAPPSPDDPRAAARFAAFARDILSAHYGAALAPRTIPGIRKRFALVSSNYQVIGDAKYVASLGGRRSSATKFALISEDVWLLQKSQAAHTFLAYGNDPQVPLLWLRRHGNLASDVAFFYLTDDGELEFLHPSSRFVA